MSDTLAVAGLHHVTAIAGDPQRNLDFYCQALGQHLVKTTVNFDDPGVYHLYFGDAQGNPGTIYTSFPFPNARAGRVGAGMASTIVYGLPDARARAKALADQGVPVQQVMRFGAATWAFADPDGQPLELAEGPGGLQGVTLWLDDPEPTAQLLTQVFGYVDTGTEPDTPEAEAPGQRRRLVRPGTAAGRMIDLLQRPGAAPARSGAGTVHHIAFRARDRAHQDALAQALVARGLYPTERKDRSYFESIYFREPGGVLFEIATDAPGFATDEAPDALGRQLKLPPQHEPLRDRIKAVLPPLNLASAP
ncbi:MAG: ring-cleaving dioxygenase [Pararhodobacter sp.]